VAEIVIIVTATVTDRHHRSTEKRSREEVLVARIGDALKYMDGIDGETVSMSVSKGAADDPA
jgi:Tfp pilus assembly protein PilF